MWPVLLFFLKNLLLCIIVTLSSLPGIFKCSLLNNFLSWWNYSQLRFNWTKEYYIYGGCIYTLRHAYMGELTWCSGWLTELRHRSMQVRTPVTITFELIPTGKVFTLYHLQLWVKCYNFRTIRMPFALNNPRSLICHKTKKPKHPSPYIYIYILKNLLNNSTYGKGKKNASNSKIKIYNESLSRGEKYILEKKKKEKANLVTPIEKNQQIRNRLVKRKKIAAKLQVQKVLNTK